MRVSSFSLILLVILAKLNVSVGQDRLHKHMTLIPKGNYEFSEQGIEQSKSINAFWISHEVTYKDFLPFVTYLQENQEDSLAWVDWKNYNQTQSIKQSTRYISHKKLLESITASLLNTDGKLFAKVNKQALKSVKNYPVKGITYQVANFYCVWKSQIARENTKEITKHLLWIFDYPMRKNWNML